MPVSLLISPPLLSLSVYQVLVLIMVGKVLELQRLLRTILNSVQLLILVGEVPLVTQELGRQIVLVLNHILRYFLLNLLVNALELLGPLRFGL